MTPPIRFGTSGWRGTLADEITGPRVRALAGAVAAWMATTGGGRRVWVAHDTRWLGPELAAMAAGVLARRGLSVWRIPGAVATPVVTHGVGRGRADAALIFTASHNPPGDHGVKVVGASGASLSPAESRRVEQLAARALREAVSAARPPRRRVDPRPAYLASLRELLDPEAARHPRVDVIYDAMHGAGSGLCEAALRAAGARVRALRATPDPRFGGAAPDPAPAHLAELVARVRAGRGRWLGLANDGDADRFAVVDRDGSLLRESEALALLVDHLARAGRLRGGLALSRATGSLVERVARAHGLPVERHPIGFKYLSRALGSGRAAAAGEESGGFALGAHGVDKDGVLAACLVAELAGAHPGPLRARLRALERIHGVRTCGRAAVRADAARRARVSKLRRDPPSRVDGRRVSAIDRRDGLWMELPDGFLMLRGSGTESVVRIYAEAPGPAALARRLAAGRRLLDPRRPDARGRRGGVG